MKKHEDHQENKRKGGEKAGIREKQSVGNERDKGTRTSSWAQAKREKGNRE